MRRALTTAILCTALTAGAADKYAADWLGYGAGARALGMGGAFVAVADDATSPYWNPAGMPSVEKAAVAAMHSYAFNGLAAYDSLFGAYNFGRAGAAGGGLLMYSVDDIPITGWNDPNAPNRRPVLEGYADSVDYALYGSYGREVVPKIKAGISGIYLLGDHLSGFDYAADSSGQDLDVGFIAGPFGPVKIGVNVQDLYGRLKWDTGTTETIPTTAKVGGAYAAALEKWQSDLTVAVDCDVRFAGYDTASQLHAGEASFDFRGGAEWWYRRTLALRLGTERSAFAGGVGLAARALGMAFGVDYAFLSDTGLDSSHRASVSAEF